MIAGRAIAVAVIARPGLPWIFRKVLAAGLGLATPLAGTGVWIGLATGLTFAAVLLLWRWYRREALGLTGPQGS